MDQSIGKIGGGHDNDRLGGDENVNDALRVCHAWWFSIGHDTNELQRFFAGDWH